MTKRTGACVRLEVTGPIGPPIERLRLDLARNGPGSATRTTVEHVGACTTRNAADHVTILAPRSTAASLHRPLVAAARSVA